MAIAMANMAPKTIGWCLAVARFFAKTMSRTFPLYYLWNAGV
jgi:hypothetical protein